MAKVGIRNRKVLRRGRKVLLGCCCEDCPVGCCDIWPFGWPAVGGLGRKMVAWQLTGFAQHGIPPNAIVVPIAINRSVPVFASGCDHIDTVVVREANPRVVVSCGLTTAAGEWTVYPGGNAQSIARFGYFPSFPALPPYPPFPRGVTLRIEATMQGFPTPLLIETRCRAPGSLDVPFPGWGLQMKADLAGPGVTVGTIAFPGTAGSVISGGGWGIDDGPFPNRRFLNATSFSVALPEILPCCGPGDTLGVLGK